MSVQTATQDTAGLLEAVVDRRGAFQRTCRCHVESSPRRPAQGALPRRSRREVQLGGQAEETGCGVGVTGIERHVHHPDDRLGDQVDAPPSGRFSVEGGQQFDARAARCRPARS